MKLRGKNKRQAGMGYNKQLNTFSRLAISFNTNWIETYKRENISSTRTEKKSRNTYAIHNRYMYAVRSRGK